MKNIRQFLEGSREERCRDSRGNDYRNREFHIARPLFGCLVGAPMGGWMVSRYAVVNSACFGMYVGVMMQC